MTQLLQSKKTDMAAEIHSVVMRYKSRGFNHLSVPIPNAPRHVMKSQENRPDAFNTQQVQTEEYPVAAVYNSYLNL